MEAQVREAVRGLLALANRAEELGARLSTAVPDGAWRGPAADALARSLAERSRRTFALADTLRAAAARAAVRADALANGAGTAPPVVPVGVR